MKKTNYAFKLALTCDLISILPISLVVFIATNIAMLVQKDFSIIYFFATVLWVALCNGVLFLIIWLIGYIYSKNQKILVKDDGLYVGILEFKVPWVDIKYIVARKFILVYDVEIRVRTLGRSIGYFFLTEEEMIEFVRLNKLNIYLRGKYKEVVENENE